MERRHTTTRPAAPVLERVFEAPFEVVWQAWTDPEHLYQWWAPTDGIPHETIELWGGGMHSRLRLPGNTGRVPDAASSPQQHGPAAVRRLPGAHDGRLSQTRSLLNPACHKTGVASVYLEDLGDGRTKLTLS